VVTRETRQLRGFARDCAPSGQSQNRSLHFGEKGRWKGSDFLDGGNLYSHFFASLISPNHFLKTLQFHQVFMVRFFQAGHRQHQMFFQFVEFGLDLYPDFLQRFRSLVEAEDQAKEEFAVGGVLHFVFFRSCR